MAFRFTLNTLIYMYYLHCWENRVLQWSIRSTIIRSEKASCLVGARTTSRWHENAPSNPSWVWSVQHQQTPWEVSIYPHTVPPDRNLHISSSERAVWSEQKSIPANTKRQIYISTQVSYKTLYIFIGVSPNSQSILIGFGSISWY